MEKDFKDLKDLTLEEISVMSVSEVSRRSSGDQEVMKRLLALMKIAQDLLY